MDEWTRDAHIPQFGNWDLTNDFPITRYFDRATTQPRLLLHNKPPRPLLNHHTKQDTRNKGRRCSHGNANKGKVYVVREQSRKQNRRRKHMQVQQDDVVRRTPKPVNEDLYKIPPELLHTSNKRDLIEKIAPTWMNVSLKMKEDPETDKAFGWVLEMYAYAVASALHGVRHILRKDFMLQVTLVKMVNEASANREF